MNVLHRPLARELAVKVLHRPLARELARELLLLLRHPLGWGMELAREPVCRQVHRPLARDLVPLPGQASSSTLA